MGLDSQAGLRLAKQTIALGDTPERLNKLVQQFHVFRIDGPKLSFTGFGFLAICRILAQPPKRQTPPMLAFVAPLENSKQSASARR
jgi:hypothetical protein